MSFVKQPAITGRQQPCLHAGVAEDLFPPDGMIAVGFGCALLTCDNRTVHAEQDGEPDMTGEQAEAIAFGNPDHDWRIVLEGPLSERVYQRHGPNQWVLIKQGNGFA